jgi:DNA-binding transcriptional regulator LsrR (DeoR family)
VISLLGGMTHSRAINPSAVARRIADAVGAECFQLTAPVFVASEANAQCVVAEPGLHDLARARAPRRSRRSERGRRKRGFDPLPRGLLPRSQLASLIAAGAVGEVLCHFLDADGNVVDHPVSRRVVAVGLDDLRRVPKIVIAAGGRHKVEAIRAVLKATRAGVLDHRRAAAEGLLQADLAG